jgi:hypothetical protein
MQVISGVYLVSIASRMLVGEVFGLEAIFFC